MTVVNIHEAKTHLSRLLRRISRGEEIVIARSGKPVAKIVPFGSPEGGRHLGRDAGRIILADDFDAPIEDFQDYME
jgi:prevent-host-death family protein